MPAETHKGGVTQQRKPISPGPPQNNVDALSDSEVLDQDFKAVGDVAAELRKAAATLSKGAREQVLNVAASLDKTAAALAEDAALQRGNAEFAAKVKKALNLWIIKYPDDNSVEQALKNIAAMEKEIHAALAIQNPAERAAKIRDLEEKFATVVLEASLQVPHISPRALTAEPGVQFFLPGTSEEFPESRDFFRSPD
jgi:hypothetical protein